jgi:hypothetical protein
MSLLIITNFREINQHNSIINCFILYHHREIYSIKVLILDLMNPQITLVPPVSSRPSELLSSPR